MNGEKTLSMYINSQRGKSFVKSFLQVLQCRVFGDNTHTTFKVTQLLYNKIFIKAGNGYGYGGKGVG